MNALELDNELVQDYLDESKDHLARMETDLLLIEKAGAAADKQLLNRARQAARTIQSGAGFFGLNQIKELTRRIEEVLDMVQSGSMIPTPHVVRTVLWARDKVGELMVNFRDGNQADISPWVNALTAIIAERTRTSPPHPTPDTGGSAENVIERPRPAKLKVLIVEDDFTSRLLLQSILSRYGAYDIAVNGKEAVGAFRLAREATQPYDLICMDIMMPEMDGVTAVRQIRALEEAKGILSSDGVKIIMTTALTEVKDVVRSFRELCDAYVCKPIDARQLAARLKSLQLIE